MTALESPWLRDVASPIVRFARAAGGSVGGMSRSRDGMCSDLLSTAPGQDNRMCARRNASLGPSGCDLLDGAFVSQSSVFCQKRMTVATRVAKQSIDDMLRSVSLWHAMCLLPAMDHQIGSNVIDSGRCRSHM